MNRKAFLRSSTVLPITQADIHYAVTVAWRFAFGVIQPLSVQKNVDIGCDCPSPDLLLQNCPWHGSYATRMCNAEPTERWRRA